MTADTKQWGAEIAVNGVRPAWLGDDDVGLFENGPGKWLPKSQDGCKLSNWCWSEKASGGAGCPIHIRLPADHFAYKALAAGFVPWGGGYEAPEDYSGGQVLQRSGEIHPTIDGGSWAHIWGAGDIIGYHKRTDAAPDRDPALWDRMVGAIKRGHEFLLAEHAAQGVAAGNDLHIDDDQFEHVIRPMLDALAEVVAELAPPVDPDLMEAREIALANSLPGFEGITSWKTRDGAADDKAFMKAILAGIKRGRQLAGEAA